MPQVPIAAELEQEMVGMMARWDNDDGDGSPGHPIIYVFPAQLLMNQRFVSVGPPHHRCTVSTGTGAGSRGVSGTSGTPATEPQRRSRHVHRVSLL